MEQFSKRDLTKNDEMVLEFLNKILNPQIEELEFDFSK